MAKKISSKSKAPKRRAPAKKAPAKSKAVKPVASKSTAKASPSKSVESAQKADGITESRELRESKSGNRTERSGDVKTGETKSTEKGEENKAAEDTKEAKDPNAVDDKKPVEEGEETKEGKKDEELDQIKDDIAGLKEALLANFGMNEEEPEEEKVEKPENLGGCSNHSSSPKAEDASEGGEKDWNKVLSASIAAVKLQKLGGGPNGNGNGINPSQGSIRGQKGTKSPHNGANPREGGLKGRSGSNVANPMKGNRGQGKGNPMAKLSADYSKAKSSGAELDPKIEQEARQLLGLPPLDKAQGSGQPSLGGAPKPVF